MIAGSNFYPSRYIFVIVDVFIGNGIESRPRRSLHCIASRGACACARGPREYVGRGNDNKLARIGDKKMQVTRAHEIGVER